MQEQLTKQSPTLGRDAVYSRTVSNQLYMNNIYIIHEPFMRNTFIHIRMFFSRKSIVYQHI